MRNKIYRKLRRVYAPLSIYVLYVYAYTLDTYQLWYSVAGIFPEVFPSEPVKSVTLECCPRSFPVADIFNDIVIQQTVAHFYGLVLGHAAVQRCDAVGK